MWRSKKSYLLITVICLLTLSCRVTRSSNTDGPQDTERQRAGGASVYQTTLPACLTTAGVVGVVVVTCVIVYIVCDRKGKKKENEKRDNEIITSFDMKEQLEILRDGIRRQINEVETEHKSVEELQNKTEAERSADTTDEYLREQEKLLILKNKLGTRKGELENLQANTVELLHNADQISRRMTKHVE